MNKISQMSSTCRNEDTAGAALVQVQDDLQRLKFHLKKLNDTNLGKTINFQELENAIRNTESEIQKRADECLRAVNNQLIVYPRINTLQSKTLIPKWDAGEKCLPILPLQRQLKAEKSKLCTGPVSNSQRVEQTAAGQKRGNHKATALHFGQDLQRSNLRYLIGVKNFELKLSRPDVKSKCESIPEERPNPSIRTPPPSINSQSTDHRQSIVQDQFVDAPTNKLNFTIELGHIKPTDEEFYVFKRSCSLFWSSVEHTLGHLSQLLQAYAVPVAVVGGERLLELAQGWDFEWRGAPAVSQLLSVLHNREDVLQVLSRPGQRFKGEGGTEAAVVHIQSCWRRYTARKTYLGYWRRKWAVGVISVSWLMQAQKCHVRKALQARRFSQLENQRQRIQHLAANWNHIRASKRTIIHVPSLGYTENQRRKLRDFDILQNLQMGRLFEIRDENIEVIYVCPVHLNEVELQYYSTLLKSYRTQEESTAGPNENTLSKGRFMIVTPEAVDYFPNHSMCLSSLLKHSPRTLKRIKHLIQGKEAYMVPGVTHIDDLAVADDLGVPLLGPEPSVTQLYNNKSGARKILSDAGVDMAPGVGYIYSLEQLHECLAELLVQNLEVKRWVFKMGSGCGETALCDVNFLKSYNWALREFQRNGPQAWTSRAIQEPVLLSFLKEVPEWLSSHARPAKTSPYSTWTSFLHSFLRQGGVVEAWPPSESLFRVTVDLFLEPGGNISLLSCGDQLLSLCGLEVLGSVVPQRSVDPKILQPLCVRLGQACLQKNIIGHISVHLVGFTHCTSKQQTVWVLDLHLSYSDHLAMTQMLLHKTQGALCWQNSLQVPMSNAGNSGIKEKRFAVVSSSLFHSSLSMLYRTVFFQMCKLHGIGFNIQNKQGTLFALFDSSERRQIGMIVVSESPEGTLVTFGDNLSVIHQEISSSRKQGKTNFKDMIKEIEDVLQKCKRRDVVCSKNI